MFQTQTRRMTPSPGHLLCGGDERVAPCTRELSFVGAESQLATHHSTGTVDQWGLHGLSICKGGFK